MDFKVSGAPSIAGSGILLFAAVLSVSMWWNTQNHLRSMHARLFVCMYVCMDVLCMERQTQSVCMHAYMKFACVLAYQLICAHVPTSQSPRYSQARSPKLKAVSRKPRKPEEAPT